MNFTTKDLLIGPTVNDTVAVGPKDDGGVLTKILTDQDGFAQFNITAGIYLVNVDKWPTGYFNVITHLRTGWIETLTLKPYQNNPESAGPYEGPIGSQAGFSAYNIINIQNLSCSTWESRSQQLPSF